MSQRVPTDYCTKCGDFVAPVDRMTWMEDEGLPDSEWEDYMDYCVECRLEVLADTPRPDFVEVPIDEVPTRKKDIN